MRYSRNSAWVNRAKECRGAMALWPLCGFQIYQNKKESEHKEKKKKGEKA